MVLSMTGFGRVEKIIDDAKLHIEIKTVNHRFLDMSLNIPSFLHSHEEQIKASIRSHFNRGRVELYISNEGSPLEKQTIVTDWSLLDQYHHAIKSIEEKYRGHSKHLVDRLPELTDVIKVTQDSSDHDGLIDELIELIDNACIDVKVMRQLEGEKLAQDIHIRIAEVQRLIEKLDQMRDQIKEKHYQRMLDRLNDLLTSQGIGQDDRFYYELAVIAEKGDLTEELIRVESHIDQMLGLLESGTEIGRKLDFITQELIREANTIGSKANDPTISGYVIELKATIEKIKEQVQNIE